MRKIFLILLLVMSIGVFAQQPECVKFKNGKFKIPDSELGDSYIIRDGSRQIEYADKSNIKLEFRVKWLDDCTYTLKLKKILENPDKVKLPRGLIITVKIIEVRENSYLQRTTSNLYDLVLEKEMIKME